MVICWVACLRLLGVGMLTRYRVKACHPANQDSQNTRAAFKLVYQFGWLARLRLIGAGILVDRLGCAWFVARFAFFSAGTDDNLLVPADRAEVNNQ